MAQINESDILFDDAILLQTILGNDAQRISSINANCDCVSYISVDDDNQVLNTPAVSGPLTEAC